MHKIHFYQLAHNTYGVQQLLTARKERTNHEKIVSFYHQCIATTCIIYSIVILFILIWASPSKATQRKQQIRQALGEIKLSMVQHLFSLNRQFDVVKENVQKKPSKECGQYNASTKRSRREETTKQQRCWNNMYIMQVSTYSDEWVAILMKQFYK